MFTKVYLGYRDGIRLPSPTSSPALYGNVISARIEGLDVLHLWPHDLPVNAVTSESVPLATLWRPQVSGFLQAEFGLTGYECSPTGTRARWLLQRWFVQPMDHAGILRNMNARPVLGEIPPVMR